MLDSKALWRMAVKNAEKNIAQMYPPGYRYASEVERHKYRLILREYHALTGHTETM